MTEPTFVYVYVVQRARYIPISVAQQHVLRKSRWWYLKQGKNAPDNREN